MGPPVVPHSAALDCPRSELFRLAAAVRAVESFLADLPKPRFVDLNTGIRARYFEWGAANQDGTVLLLHDLAHTGASASLRTDHLI